MSVYLIASRYCQVKISGNIATRAGHTIVAGNAELDIVAGQNRKVVLTDEGLVLSECYIVVGRLNGNASCLDSGVIVQEYIIFSGHIIPKKSCAIARSQ